MSRPDSFNQFLALVQRVYAGTTARSENDLSSRFTSVLKELDLHTVIDTRVSTGGRKRPDILAYVSEEDADLVLPAEVVIESKKPDEVNEFRNLAEAIVSEKYWHSKTFPYLRDNISRVQYFAFTTFTEFAVFAVTRNIRNKLIDAIKADDSTCTKLRKQIRSQVLLFNPYDVNGTGANSAKAWKQWLQDHLRADVLQPVPLSNTRNSLPVKTESELQELATRLAIFAAGSGDSGLPDAGLFNSIRQRLGNDYDALQAEIRRDLLIFVMSQHVDMNTSEAEVKVREDVPTAIDEFVAASIHSLISRLFAVKVIEDAYCVGATNSLVEPDLWLFAVDAYDALEPEKIRSEVFSRIRRLTTSDNPVVRRLIQYGFFFDWIENYIDPILFRSLFETLSTHDFSEIEGDLLGRFYELYAQQTNRSRRRALGQYYTPLPVVEFMWHQATQLTEERGELDHVMVLDPAMGSATFLTEGARSLADAGVDKFWERLTGFDVSAQILGIAYVNLYMAVLSRLTPDVALEVEDLRLYATDTLDYENENHLKQLLPLITDEAHRIFLQQRVAISTRAKRQGSYRLVIGNPPYKNNSNLTLAQVADRFPKLLSSSVEHGGAQLRNIRDDYAWFVAAADYYVRDAGLICFILSDSFALSQSYEHFRAEILKNYHVRMLVRLGTHIFPDVSYRTSFAILMLERRAEPLESAEESEEIPYTDLRGLVSDTPSNELGTLDDPRLIYLRDVVSGEQEFEITEYHVPSPLTRFSFYPVGQASARFKDMAALHGDKGEPLFIDTHPGIITAFDVLFKGSTREELQERLTSLYDICRRRISDADLVRQLDQWGQERDFTNDQINVLQGLGAQIKQKSLTFDANKIKRSFSGSIPESAKWYPPAEHIHYLYYEPALRVPRKENPGKQVGWGSMNQWREPASHTITPKLIYTTAKSTRHGYAAFVTDDEWYVKLHGGTSQQFNYTGLNDPSRSQRMGGVPNNLTGAGEELYTILINAGGTEDSILHYIAGVWNSELAKELLDDVGTSMRPGIKIPETDVEKKIALEIAEGARFARDIVHLSQLVSLNEPTIPADVLDSFFDKGFLREFGITRVVNRSRRFRSQEHYAIPAGLKDQLPDWLESVESQINSLVETLYP
ncbi:MAG TPA: N-6 DNA methylase [Pyrinomonadaceae bacterium]|nr:N-6 DNA methylase [Pyrinomonadaceae bacterium]